MNRREAMKLMGFSMAPLAMGCGNGASQDKGIDWARETSSLTESPIYAGWNNDQKAVKQFVARNANPFITQLDDAIRGTGEGKVALLWRAFEDATGSKLMPHAQTIGDCVSHGYGSAVDILTCCQIILKRKFERWVAEAATEPIYAGSRVEIGGGKIRGDGSMGVWAANWIRKYGILLRQEYVDGKFDFTTYSGNKARKMGARGAGVPDALEPIAKFHPVRTTSLVRTWEECRDAVANGYPVIMCSNVGFKTRRDKDGFLRRGRRPWFHAMCIVGIDDDFRRPGACILNSWGEHWVSGPTRHEQPVGSFWCDAATIDTAMRQGDSLAISGYNGYPRGDFPDYMIW